MRIPDGYVVLFHDIHGLDVKFETRELVLCKNCKHRDSGAGFCEGRGWPSQLVPDDSFCDKGERSEE